MIALDEELEVLKAAGLERTLREISAVDGAHLTWNNRVFLNFASNNYLGLSRHPGVIARAKAALDQWGTGSTASRLLAGHFSIHRQLEERIARWKGVERALVFPSGYHASLAAITALAGPEDTVIMDRLCHASLVDGARLSGARLKVFQHNDAAELDQVMRRYAPTHKTIVVTESVFSMDGDLAPLQAIHETVSRQGGFLLVDEAHASGLWGPGGAGRISAERLTFSEELIQMGTMSKALGSQGGYIAGSKSLVQWLIQRARSFIYTTGLNPASCGAALEAIELAHDETRRNKVFELARALRAGLREKGWKVLSDEGPIVPVLIGDERKAVETAQQFMEQGIFAPAIRFPTVPKGESRIRFSVTADHSEGDIAQLLASSFKLEA